MNKWLGSVDGWNRVKEADSKVLTWGLQWWGASGLVQPQRQWVQNQQVWQEAETEVELNSKVLVQNSSSLQGKHNQENAWVKEAFS
jgi:hypothetical protein